MYSRLQDLLAHTHLIRLLMCTTNIYVDHINITDKDSATFTGDLGFFPHTKPTWPVNKNSILRHCLIKYDFTEDTRVSLWEKLLQHTPPRSYLESRNSSQLVDIPHRSCTFKLSTRSTASWPLEKSRHFLKLDSRRQGRRWLELWLVHL
jgi:hypothetical protein